MYKNPKKMAECFETQHDMERDMKNRVEKFEAENERLRDARVGNRGWRMRKVDEALADVRRWLCDNLSDGNAGMICGMLSVVSRHINELEAENDKLRELVAHLMFVKPNNVSAILYEGKVLRFEDLLAEVGMRWESEVPE